MFFKLLVRFYTLKVTVKQLEDVSLRFKLVDCDQTVCLQPTKC